jgi:hypothetical protein
VTQEARRQLPHSPKAKVHPGFFDSFLDICWKDVTGRHAPQLLVKFKKGAHTLKVVEEFKDEIESVEQMTTMRGAPMQKYYIQWKPQWHPFKHSYFASLLSQLEQITKHKDFRADDPNNQYDLKSITLGKYERLLMARLFEFLHMDPSSPYSLGLKALNNPSCKKEFTEWLQMVHPAF